MRTYLRYLTIQLLAPTLFATVALAGAVWISQALRHADLVVNKGLPVTTFLGITLLLMPSLLLVVLPIAAFAGVLFAYNKLSADSEIAVLRAAGLSHFDLARPALLVGGLVVVLGYGLSLYLMPLALSAFKEVEAKLGNSLAYLMLQEGVFNSPTKGLTVFVRARAQDGTLRGLLVHDARQPDAPVTVMAERGRLVETPAGPRFLLLDGSRQELDPAADVVSVLHFRSYAVDVRDDEAVASRWRKPKERFLPELFNPADTPEDREHRTRLIAEGHERLAWPLGGLSLVVVAAACLLPREAGRRGLGQALGLAVLLGIGVQAAGLVAASLTADDLAFAPLLYLVHLIPIALGVARLVGGRRRPRAAPRATGGRAIGGLTPGSRFGMNA